MTEVRLHGALAQEFGKCWFLDISTPAEAVRAIECARKGFKAAILRLGELGHVFRVRSKDHDYGNEDVNATLGSVERIDIIPIVRGASAGVRFVVGAVLVAVGTLASGITAGTSNALVSAGIGLMVGSVVEWLTPKPKRPEDNSRESWTFSGPSNTTDQGVPVPVIYGEVLTGAIVVSAGITVDESVNGYSTDGVTIGGNLDLAGHFESGGVHTQILTVSASIVGGRYPLAFNWSFTGFSGAIAHRWVQSNSAVAKLELDYDISPGPTTTDTGVVYVSVPAQLRGGTDYGQSTKTLTASANVTVWNRVPL